MLEWANLLVRWVHVIAAIMWIGDSFLFMWLDSHLSESERSKTDDAVTGELWMVHSGGFYEVYKRKYLKGTLPQDLYWFKWESYSTWLSGALLLVVVYYAGGSAFMVDQAGPLSYHQAIAVSVAAIVLAWLAYDALCFSPLAKDLRVFGVVGLVLITGIAFGFTRYLIGRSAFLHTGALLGTIMASNVFFRIIPSQRALLAATKAGTTPDVTLGLRAKMRSRHNHFLTLPVLLMMLSNHFASVYGHAHNWLLLGVIVLLGAAMKQIMITKTKSHPVILGAAVVCAGVLFWAVGPRESQAAVDLTGPQVSFAETRKIIEMRCNGCHATKPTIAGIAAPPNGLVLETPEKIYEVRELIKLRVVGNRTMPLGNLTGITEEERVTLGRWVDQGGKTQ